MNLPISRRSFAGVLAGGLVAAPVRAESRDWLYLISACPNPHGEGDFPVVLYACNPASQHVEWASEIVSKGSGLPGIFPCPEWRTFAVIYRTVNAIRVVLASFDKPGDLRWIMLNSNSSLSTQPYWALQGARKSLVFQRLSKDNPGFTNVHLDGLEIFDTTEAETGTAPHIEGMPGGITFSTRYLHVMALENGRDLVKSLAKPGRPILLSVPPRYAYTPGHVAQVIAINKHCAVLYAGRVRERDGDAGTITLRILDRLKDRWYEITVPGSGSSVRLLGEWLAVQVMYPYASRRVEGNVSVYDDSIPHKNSPGVSRRQREPRITGFGFDIRARALYAYCPGTLYLHHVPSGRTVQQETGQGDSEVLWVEGEKILYRSDRALYEASLRGTRLLNPRRVLTRNFVADVHWAFYAPPSEPPPEPPWPSFGSLD